jgi:hypothetical protein
MSEMVRLELPYTLVQQARTIAANTGQSVEDVLIAWVNRGAALQDISPLRTDVEYPIYTPYGMEDAAQELWEYLQAEEAKPTVGPTDKASG